MILSIFAATFAISIGLLYLNYRFLRSELAERQRAEKLALESQESLRLLSTRLLHIQDEERRKFSREVHDSLGQYLNLVKMSLSTLANRYSAAELSEFARVSRPLHRRDAHDFLSAASAAAR